MHRLVKADYPAFEIAVYRLIDNQFGLERFQEYRQSHQDDTLGDSHLVTVFEDWLGEEITPKQLAKDYVGGSGLNERLGPKPRGGRPLADRQQLVIRIKKDVLGRLQPGAARKIRDLVETTYANNSQRIND
jgi:hypothetical protein